VMQMDRRKNTVRDEAGVIEKFGVKPESIPDYLGVVGDTADGYPGIAGWGAKAASAVLSHYHHLENIPQNPQQWLPTIRRTRTLAETLFNSWNDALLFRTLATLRLDVPVFTTLDDLRWKGSQPNFAEFCTSLKSSTLAERAGTCRRNAFR
jgi:5'-3' exonuclease